MRRSLTLTLIAALGAGCTQFPQLDATVSDKMRRAPYPDLVPLEGLQKRIDATRIDPATLPTIQTRIARLKTRAERLRGTVVDSDAKARMQEGVQQ